MVHCVYRTRQAYCCGAETALMDTTSFRTLVIITPSCQERWAVGWCYPLVRKYGGKRHCWNTVSTFWPVISFRSTDRCLTRGLWGECFSLSLSPCVSKPILRAPQLARAARGVAQYRLPAWCWLTSIPFCFCPYLHSLHLLMYMVTPWSWCQRMFAQIWMESFEF